MCEPERIKRLSDAIRIIHDFPSPGIAFRDIFSLTKSPQLLSDCVMLLVDHIRNHCSDVDVIVGLDARGFIFGSLVAQQMSLPFVPVRKEGKLPGETIKVAYSLEYAEGVFEVQKDACIAGQKVVIVDDLLATGGSMQAAVLLMQKLNTVVLQCIVVIELVSLNGRSQVPVDVFALILQ